MIDRKTSAEMSDFVIFGSKEGAPFLHPIYRMIVFFLAR